MSPDRFRTKYVGKHWTEKSKKYNIINLSRPGYSNFNIITELHHAIEHNIQFDYVLIWFTEHRLTLENIHCDWLGSTVTDCMPEYLTDDQKIAVKYYVTEISESLKREQTALEILGVLSWLKNKEFKFLFNLGLWDGLKFIRPGCNVHQELMKFQNNVYNLSEINLEHYTSKNKLIFDRKSGPSYHTNELWQDHISQVVGKKFQEVYGE
jgi:hypothetical protein